MFVCTLFFTFNDNYRPPLEQNTVPQKPEIKKMDKEKKKHKVKKDDAKIERKHKKEKVKKQENDINLLGDIISEDKADKKNSSNSKKDTKEKRKAKKKDKESKYFCVCICFSLKFVLISDKSKSKKPTAGYEEAVGISTPSKEFP